MLAAVAKALDQMFTPPFRAVLLKSVGLAVALLVVLVVVLFRLLGWLSGTWIGWLEVTLGPWAHGPLAMFGWIIAFALGIGLLAGAILLMPAVTAVVASLFSDEIAEIVERTHYPADPPGRALICQPEHFLRESDQRPLLSTISFTCWLNFSARASSSSGRCMR